MLEDGDLRTVCSECFRVQPEFTFWSVDGRDSLQVLMGLGQVILELPSGHLEEYMTLSLEEARRMGKHLLKAADGAEGLEAMSREEPFRG